VVSRCGSANDPPSKSKRYAAFFYAFRPANEIRDIVCFVLSSIRQPVLRNAVAARWFPAGCSSFRRSAPQRIRAPTISSALSGISMIDRDPPRLSQHSFKLSFELFRRAALTGR
jgi:hypothetical protein